MDYVVSAGPGYRFLERGDTVKDRDEVFIHGQWLPADRFDIGGTLKSRLFRRKMNTEQKEGRVELHLKKRDNFYVSVLVNEKGETYDLVFHLMEYIGARENSLKTANFLKINFVDCVNYTGTPVRGGMINGCTCTSMGEPYLHYKCGTKYLKVDFYCPVHGHINHD